MPVRGEATTYQFWMGAGMRKDRHSENLTPRGLVCPDLLSVRVSQPTRARICSLGAWRSKAGSEGGREERPRLRVKQSHGYAIIMRLSKTQAGRGATKSLSSGSWKSRNTVRIWLIK